MIEWEARRMWMSWQEYKQWLDLVDPEPAVGLTLQSIKKKWMIGSIRNITDAVVWSNVLGSYRHSTLDRTAGEVDVWFQVQDPGPWQSRRHLHVIGFTEPCMQILMGEESYLHLLCNCDALVRQRLEIFRLGYPTPKAIKEATLGKCCPSLLVLR